MGADSFLALGKRFSAPGIGVSARARQMNQQFLAQSASTGNKLLSLTVGSSASIEGLQKQVAALRAKLPASALSSEVRAQFYDTEV